MNVVPNPDPDAVPEQAKGNPVYEQTRQDMPCWCCGRNCGRNSRVVVFVLGIIGIVCSSIVCLSPHFFSFVSMRNDTFYDPDKQQPVPFEYATEANVGLFRYEILEVYEYPWPPQDQRDLFDAIHDRELERLAANDNESRRSSNSIGWSLNRLSRLLVNKFPNEFYDDDDNVDNDEDSGTNPSAETNVTQHQNDTIAIVLTKSPSDTPPPDNKDIPVSDIPEVLPGSNVLSRLPTTSPTPSPTRTNPNELIDVDIGVVKGYPAGVDFDSLFKNGQKGAMWAPILATIGLAFALVEFFCCTYKCSWLPTALCLYGAFMLQMMTLFLFMSDDFCNYTQDCVLGFSGVLSSVAVIAYMISQMLVCMTPRPPPIYNLCKKPPVRRKKKKKKKKADDFDEKWGLTDEDDEGVFIDEPNDGDGDYYQEEPYDPSNDDYNYNDDDYDDGYYDDDDYDDDRTGGERRTVGKKTDKYDGKNK